MTAAAARDRTRSARRRAGGFTLLEVMIGLALLGLGLTVLIKSAAGNIADAQEAHMMGIATDLARGKMYDLEDKLIKDGFTDTEQHEDDQPFADEGWPAIHYSYKIELLELPGWDALQAMVTGQGSGAGSAAGAGAKRGSGSGAESGVGFDEGEAGGFQNSMLGGMMSQFSGLAGFGGKGIGGAAAGSGSADIGAAAGASFIQSQYSMFQQILKVTIRRVSLTVSWTVMGRERDMKVVAFFTDAGSMDKVINGMGSQDLDDVNAAKGSGRGSGSSSGSGRPSTTTPPPTKRGSP